MNRVIVKASNQEKYITSEYVRKKRNQEACMCCIIMYFCKTFFTGYNILTVHVPHLLKFHHDE